MFNKIISKIRVRIEHVFGFVENSMHGSSYVLLDSIELF
jgi:hypothetical protein